MAKTSRRDFLKLSAAGAVSFGSFSALSTANASTDPHVVIIGGGFGGATAAKYLRLADQGIKVTLIEKDKTYYTCPKSNDVIAGIHEMHEIAHTYDVLEKKYGVNMMYDTVVGVNANRRTLKTQSGKSVTYDRLIVSPGVDFKWEAIEGYNADVAETMVPHAWKAGPQTVLMRKQLEAMPNGGTVVVVAPPNPYRCPPGPYERVSLLAHYIKTNKPKSKILVLDPKDRFSKQGLFTKGWRDLYGFGTDNSIIEWKPAAEDGKITAVDAKNKTVITAEFEDEIQGDVVNIIPPQKAGKVAFAMNLTNDKGWCPVDQKTFESTLVPNIHVIGDSSIAGKMPKSGYAANTQAKVCAAAIANLLRDREVGTPSFANTCYSFIAPDYGISVAAVYRLTENGIAGVKGAGGLTPMEANRTVEAVFARSWHLNIAADIWDT